MTEKELHRLGRKDLLQLLVTQGREALTLQEELDGCHTKNAELDATLTRLKDKLDEKDALIEKLKGRLDQKDARIRELEEEMAEWKKSRRIELEKAGSIAEASLRLNGVFEAAQKAADQYLENIRQHADRRENESIQHEEA